MSQYEFPCDCGKEAEVKIAFGALIAECLPCGLVTPPRIDKHALEGEWRKVVNDSREALYEEDKRRLLGDVPKELPPEPTEPEPPRCQTCYWRGEAVEYPNVLCHAIGGDGEGSPKNKDGWCSLHPLATPWLEWRYDSHLKEVAAKEPKC
jgi:hypothetical protein